MIKRNRGPVLGSLSGNIPVLQGKRRPGLGRVANPTVYHGTSWTAEALKRSLDSRQDIDVATLVGRNWITYVVDSPFLHSSRSLLGQQMQNLRDLEVSHLVFGFLNDKEAEEILADFIRLVQGGAEFRSPRLRSALESLGEQLALHGEMEGPALDKPAIESYLWLMFCAARVGIRLRGVHESEVVHELRPPDPRVVKAGDPRPEPYAKPKRRGSPPWNRPEMLRSFISRETRWQMGELVSLTESVQFWQTTLENLLDRDGTRIVVFGRHPEIFRFSQKAGYEGNLIRFAGNPTTKPLTGAPGSHRPFAENITLLAPQVGLGARNFMLKTAGGEADADFVLHVAR